VDSPSFEDYVLERTGKEQMDAVSGNIKERMKSLYLEIVKPETTLLSSRLLNCVNYIKNSDEVAKDVIDAFIKYDKQFEFDKRKLYFAVY